MIRDRMLKCIWDELANSMSALSPTNIQNHLCDYCMLFEKCDYVHIPVQDYYFLKYFPTYFVEYFFAYQWVNNQLEPEFDSSFDINSDKFDILSVGCGGGIDLLALLHTHLRWNSWHGVDATSWASMARVYATVTSDIAALPPACSKHIRIANLLLTESASNIQSATNRQDEDLETEDLAVERIAVDVFAKKNTDVNFFFFPRSFEEIFCSYPNNPLTVKHQMLKDMISGFNFSNRRFVVFVFSTIVAPGAAGSSDKNIKDDLIKEAIQGSETSGSKTSGLDAAMKAHGFAPFGKQHPNNILTPSGRKIKDFLGNNPYPYVTLTALKDLAVGCSKLCPDNSSTRYFKSFPMLSLNYSNVWTAIYKRTSNESED